MKYFPEPKFIYPNQHFNMYDNIFFIAWAVMDIFFVIGYITKYDNLLVFENKLAFALLLILFNTAAVIYLIARLVKIFRFNKIIENYITNGRCYRAKVVSEAQDKVLFADDMNTYYTYIPTVSYFDVTKMQEVTLKSPYPVCASYRKTLSSEAVTIYVIDDNFIITEFTSAENFSDSLEWRKSDTRKRAEKTLSTKTKLIIIIIALVFLAIGLFAEFCLSAY